MATIRGTMGLGTLTSVIKCPDGRNQDDWISMHAVEFYNQLTIFYSVVADSCTPESCPHMTAGPGYKYLWKDNNRYKTPTDMPAKEYISLLFDWADERLGDTNFFPSDPKANYPPEFKAETSKIFTRFLRIFAHIYIHHSHELKDSDAMPTFNSLFIHFYKFVKYFDLIQDEKEFGPLKPVLTQLNLE